MGKNTFYIHSKCCNAHWELVYCKSLNEYGLFCEKCGKPIGSGIEIVGANLTGCECSQCKQEKN